MRHSVTRHLPPLKDFEACRTFHFTNRKWKTKIFFITIFLSLFALSAAPQKRMNAEQTNEIESSSSVRDSADFSSLFPDRNIVVGLNDDFPPYEFINEKGNPDGYDVDFIKAVAGRMNLKVTFVSKPWNELRQMLIHGKIDALAGMLYSAEREKLHRFSSSILTVHYSIFTRSETSGITSLNSLQDKTIIVEQGSLMHDFMKSGNYHVNLVFVNSEPKALRRLASGVGDAALVSHLQGLLIAEQFNLTNVKPAVNSIFSTKLCVAVNKSNSELAATINEGLAILAKTGQSKDIYEKWFGQITPEDKIAKLVLRYAFAVAAAALLTIGGFGFWNYSLKKKVAEKTAELIKSEENNRMLIEQASDTILVFDADEKLIDVNASAVSMFGFSHEQLLRMKLKNIFSEEEYHNNPLQLEVINEKVPHLSQHLLMHKGVHEFYAEINSKKLNDGRYQSIVRNINERKLAEIEIQNSLREKEVLLKEIHHRVKNNLQIVISLLSLQAKKVTEKEALAALLESQNRIKSMTMIHEKLYQSKSLSLIDMNLYIINLAQQILNSYKTDKQVELKFDLQKINLSFDFAMPVGLIINELVSNALKYAYQTKDSGELLISFSSPETKEYMLVVQDNGVGLPAGISPENPNSLGLKLVTILAKQLNGTVEIFNAVGAKFVVKFNEREGISS